MKRDGQEGLIQELSRLQASLAAEARNCADEKSWLNWWRMSGYANILAKAVKDIDEHKQRADKIQGKQV